ncbi:MAG: hypothetical protein ACJAR2_001110 [Ilumatobacter sp.]|jgi:hypothetical protein
MTRSHDHRQTTQVIRQISIARYCMVAYNVGWHLAHYVDIGVPWRSFPTLHNGLVEAGWITPDLEYQSNRAFWRSIGC